jgi:hypothetical protein
MMQKAGKNILQRLLRLEADESHPFYYLFSHAFFNGLGVSLAFAVINILVIKKQGIEILPWLYVGTSILLIIAGIFYNKLEHAYPPKTVFTFSLMFCVTWAFAMRFFLGPDKSLLFLGLAYATYYLILVLTNLDLWGSAALIFNVRQSKRLFGPLSFAESIGSIIGYSLTPIILLFIPIQDVMILSGISFLLSVIVLYNLRNKFLQYQPSPEDHHTHHTTAAHGQSFWSKLFHDNKYIRHLSILILLSTLVYYTLIYGFLSRVEVQFTNIEDIAWFIGIFLSVAKILNLMIKFLATSHVFSKLGVQFGIKLLPIVVIVMCFIGLGFITYGVADSLFYIFLFSSLYFFDKLFRSSLSKPSFLVLFQPLTPTLRLSGHTITKGYFEPLAMGLAGLIILIAQYLGWFGLRFLVCYVLFLSIFWYLACHIGVKHYMTELHNSLKSRLFGSATMQLSKSEIDLIVSTKLNSGDAVDKLYALSLLHGQISPELEADHYTQLLSSDQKDVLVRSLAAIENFQLPIHQDVLIPLLSSSDSEVRQSAAYTMAALHDEDSIDILIAHLDENPVDNVSFIGALIKYAGLRGTLSVGHKLLELTRSTDEKDRALAAEIIDKTDNAELNSILKQLIHDASDQVSAAAIRACGPATSQDLIEAVIKKIDRRHLLIPIKRCVAANQSKALSVIRKIYPNSTRTIKRRLLELCSKIELSENQQFLVDQLNDWDLLLSSEAIKSLFVQTYKARDPKLIHSIRTAGILRLEELGKLVKLYTNTEGASKLGSGLKNEINSIYIRDILRMLSFIYDRDTIVKIIRNLAMDDPTDVANALELLENMLPNKWSNQLVPDIEKMNSTHSESVSRTSSSTADLMMEVSNRALRISDYLAALIVRSLRNGEATLVPGFIAEVNNRKSEIIQEELVYLNL